MLKLPFITESPQSQTVCSNSSVTFTAAATGTDVKYTWWRDAGDGNFVQATSASSSADYTFSASESLNGYSYKCIVTEVGCEVGVETFEATLSIILPPQITEQPQAQTVCHNSEVTFTAAAIGTDLTYFWQWFNNDGYIGSSPSSTSPDYTFTADISQNGYLYRCTIIDANCNIRSESEVVTLAVNQTQVANLTQESINICVGETATFEVEATGVGDLTYQWTGDGNNLANNEIYAGVTTAILSVTGASTPITSLLLNVTSDCGSATSTPFTLNVYGIEKPEITQQLSNPTNASLQVMNSFVLGVDNFEWFLNGNSYQNTGENPEMTLTEAGSYTVVATKNNCEHPESDMSVIVVTGFENKLLLNTLNVYPNPVNNKLTLEMGKDFDTSKESKIILTNTKGKQVYTKRYNDLYNRKVDIDMAGFESGIYRLKRKSMGG